MRNSEETQPEAFPSPPLPAVRPVFEVCAALLVFDGDRLNANGYRVMEVLDEDDALAIRYEHISYQTSSFDGSDTGDPVRPWALFVIPASDRAVRLEENV